MFTDPTAIRALAHRLRGRADDIRDLAERLVATAAATAWQGLAADAMRAAVHQAATGLRRTASMHDEAAEALERHARRVGAVHEALDEAAHAIGHALGALR